MFYGVNLRNKATAKTHKRENKEEKKEMREEKRKKKKEKKNNKRYDQYVIDYMRKYLFTTPVTTFTNLSQKFLTTFEIVWEKNVIIITKYQCTVKISRDIWKIDQFEDLSISGLSNYFNFNIICYRRGIDLGCLPQTYAMEVYIRMLPDKVKYFKYNIGNQPLNGGAYCLSYLGKTYCYQDENKNRKESENKNSKETQSKTSDKKKKIRIVQTAKIRDDLVRKKNRLRTERIYARRKDDYVAFIPTRLDKKIEMNMIDVETDDSDLIFEVEKEKEKEVPAKKNTFV